MRTILTKTLSALAITTVVAFGADNSLGTWKLNSEKSKYTPAPMPLKSLTSTREASDGGVKVTNTGEQTNGTTINATYTYKYDGKDVQVTGNAPYDTISIKQVNANTFTDQRKKTGGPYHATGRTVISNSGKTMTLTAKGTNQEGKEFTMTLVFEKQ
jgi:2',3'-cyclic-nucleotide 2'-phosphodiesterase (5'-nucleotidase family)